MTPILRTFSLDINSKLDMQTMCLIMSKGHSRVPIYSESPKNIIGLILVKNLIICRLEDETPIRNTAIRRIPRVPDHLPLYEILNEFQEGHSHMTIVVKGMKDVKRTPEITKGNTGMLGKRMKPIRLHPQSEQEERDSSLVLEVVADASVHSGGTLDSNLRNDVEKQSNVHHQLLKEWDRRSENVIDADLESLPTYTAEEEVIGIITMEDVIEELLQEEIYDETDQYLDVHTRIRTNMLPSRRSSPRSSRATSLSNFQQQTPVASPLSAYHHTPIFQSPVPSYVQSPGQRPSLSNSPGYGFPTSPAELAVPGRNSPSANRVSRKPYGIV